MKSSRQLWSSDYGTIRNYSGFLGKLLNLFRLLSILLLLQTYPGSADDAHSPSDLTTFDHVDEANGTLVFGAPSGMTPPKPLKTDLFDVKYLGTIRPPEGAPYFLVSAKPCKACQNEQAIFAVRPNDRKPTGFVYPGKIFDPKSRALLLESRAFFGKCIPSRGDLYIVFQQERVDRRSRLQSSVLVGEAAKEHLDETLIDRNAPKLRTTLQQVKRKQCQEIEGRNRLMLSRPLDLHPHSNISDDDDGEDESTKSDGDEGQRPKDELVSVPTAKLPLAARSLFARQGIT